jgi:hypothetical protein
LQTHRIKILFICSSLEPAKDGVGDYTRKLACAMISRGHDAKIIALNDRRMNGTDWQGIQYEDDVAVEVLRLSESVAWNERLEKAKKFADDFNAEWISLQYVPFGFQLKGLPFQLGKKLKSLNKNARWHIMFHELAVNKDDSLKFKFWAFFQINIIKSILKELKPAVIHTNTEIYQRRLQEMRYTTKLLPLFSNISGNKNIDVTQVNNLIPEYLLSNRNDYISGTLFGSFSFKTWNLHSLLDKFSNGYQNKKVVIASIGRMSFGDEHWQHLQNEYPHILFLTLGVHDAAFISNWLSQYTDFGILTTPPELASKSGSFMAFKEHGIPVVCTEEKIELKHFKIPLDEVLTVVSVDRNFVLPLKYQPVSVLDKVTDEFIADLQQPISYTR